MTTNTRAPAHEAEHANPLSDEYVNAVIQRHGYQSPETVIARLNQWIGLHGGEDSITLLMYEAHKALSKLCAPVADERAAFEAEYVDHCGMRLEDYDFDYDPATNRYRDDCEQSAWWGWHTGRAALASAPVADALTRQDVFDRFQFLEGLVNEHLYTEIAETALAIYESGAPWSGMEQTIRDLRAELGYVAQYGKRGLPDMCPPATSRDRWMYEQGRLAERAALASAPVANAMPIRLRAEVLEYLKEGIENATGCEDSDVDHDFANELERLVTGPLYTDPLANYREVEWGPLVVAPLAGEARVVDDGSDSWDGARKRVPKPPAAPQAIATIKQSLNVAPQASEAVRDAAFEAVRKRLCAIPRYSFHLDDDGVVRRVEGRSGGWIEFDAAHELFDPVAVDGALSAQPGAQKGGSDA